MNASRRGDLRLFATCPPSTDSNGDAYLERVVRTARWSEDIGCEGTLVYTDNRLVDPWLVAQLILQHTTSLCPLVAVQPVYMHPYTLAKKVASLGYLHGRRVWLNVVAGGFKNDLIALNDPTPHDERYDRAVEYMLVAQRLLRGETVTFTGRYYTVTNLRLAPPLPDALFPGVMISGSSPAGLTAARAIGALAVQYPNPPGEEEPLTDDTVEAGFRIGVIARERAEDAWRVAHERFPPDRRGQIAHRLAMRTSDSAWHRQLSALDEGPADERSPYWLGPFHNYRTFCPYLVGDYAQVEAEVARYVGLGARTFVLDVPASPEELGHIDRVFAGVRRRDASGQFAQSARSLLAVR